MLDVSVPAGHVHCRAAPVTVASVVHVCPSVLFCRSALLCAVPVEIECCHWNSTSFEPSITVSTGLRGAAVGVASAVESVTQSDVVTTPLFAVTATCHWMLVVPVKVLAGTVTLCALPETEIVWIVPLVPERQRKTADVCSSTAMHFNAGSVPHAKVFGSVFTIDPELGVVSNIFSPQVIVSSTVTGIYGRFAPAVTIDAKSIDTDISINTPFCTASGIGSPYVDSHSFGRSSA